MNPTLLYHVGDVNGETIFKFPPNTLLERIVDVWQLIINYYENYYPFAIGYPDKNYRELTPIEAKTDEFIKLFVTIVKQNKMKNNGIFHRRVCVGGIPLFIKGKSYIFTNGYGKMVYYTPNGITHDILLNIENICLFEGHEWGTFNDISILVLSNINFN